MAANSSLHVFYSRQANTKYLYNYAQYPYRLVYINKSRSLFLQDPPSYLFDWILDMRLSLLKFISMLQHNLDISKSIQKGSYPFPNI